MRPVPFLAACLLVVPIAGRPADKKDAPEPDPDLKLLQGTWKLTYHETAGVDDTRDTVWELEVKGDRYTLTADGTTAAGTITFDSSKTPKLLEYTVEDEDGEPKYVFAGVYELTADTYKTCDVEKAKDVRPTEFKTKAKTGQVAAWKKVKEKVKD